MNESQAISALGALAEPTRLEMFRFLVRCGEDGAPAGRIAEHVGAAASRASFHLAALTRAGLLKTEQVSRKVIYRVDFAATGSLMQFLLEDCCAGHPDIRACCAPGAGC